MELELKGLLTTTDCAWHWSSSFADVRRQCAAVDVEQDRLYIGNYYFNRQLSIEDFHPVTSKLDEHLWSSRKDTCHGGWARFTNCCVAPPRYPTWSRETFGHRLSAARVAPHPNIWNEQSRSELSRSIDRSDDGGLGVWRPSYSWVRDIHTFTPDWLTDQLGRSLYWLGAIPESNPHALPWLFQVDLVPIGKQLAKQSFRKIYSGRSTILPDLFFA